MKTGQIIPKNPRPLAGCWKTLPPVAEEKASCHKNPWRHVTITVTIYMWITVNTKPIHLCVLA